jgi:hypothetical protein
MNICRGIPICTGPAGSTGMQWAQGFRRHRNADGTGSERDPFKLRGVRHALDGRTLYRAVFSVFA